MADINDGGSAFPHPETPDCYASTGMSLRDHFAGLAMQGFCAGLKAGDNIDAVPELCFMLADAMIKARKVPNDQA